MSLHTGPSCRSENTVTTMFNDKIYSAFMLDEEARAGHGSFYLKTVLTQTGATPVLQMKYLYGFLKMAGGSARAMYLLAAFFSNQSISHHCIISELQRELTKDRVKLSGSSQAPSSRHWVSDCFSNPLNPLNLRDHGLHLSESPEQTPGQRGYWLGTAQDSH